MVLGNGRRVATTPDRGRTRNSLALPLSSPLLSTPEEKGRRRGFPSPPIVPSRSTFSRENSPIDPPRRSLKKKKRRILMDLSPFRNTLARTRRDPLLFVSAEKTGQKHGIIRDRKVWKSGGRAKSKEWARVNVGAVVEICGSRFYRSVE